MVNPVHKGKRGEELFCAWLKDNFGISVRRNHWQAEGECADIIIDDFIFEIKNRETHDLDAYWLQIITAAKAHEKDLIPIVAFKSNRVRWQFLIPANLITGIERGYVIATEQTFIRLMKYVLEK